MKSNHCAEITGKDINATGSYGDIKGIASYCGLDYHSCKLRGEWQHGWIPPERNFHPEWVIGCSGESRLHRRRHTYYVAREDQVEFLKRCGYTNIRAIGHPIIYTKKPAVQMEAKSLLVMPLHTTANSKGAYDQSFDEYLDYITSIRRHFDRVEACIYATDLGTYGQKFTKRGINIIEGAQEGDQNSYTRMLALGAQFEFMTTNNFGSHVAYLSYSGCKVSVAGPLPKASLDALKDMDFYKNCPYCLETASILDELVRKAYPSFLVNPWEARTNSEWANQQLGENNKLTPTDCLSIIDIQHSRPTLTDLTKKARGFVGKIIPPQAKANTKKIIERIAPTEDSRNQIFMLALTVQTHLTKEELSCIRYYAKSLKQGAIGVEIGSGLGASALATCSSFTSERTKLYCVDIWMNDAIAYTDHELMDPDLETQDTFDAFKNNTSFCAQNIIPLRGLSHEVFHHVKALGRNLSWLFIDGNHSYESVKNDWYLYSSILMPEALVIFHDRGWAGGVNTLIIEAVNDRCVIEAELPNMKVFRYLGEPCWFNALSH